MNTTTATTTANKAATASATAINATANKRFYGKMAICLILWQCVNVILCIAH